MKKLIILLFAVVLIFSSTLVIANDEDRTFDEDKAYSWLNQRLNETNWGNSIETMSWSIMALSNGGYNYSVGLDKLYSYIGPNGDNWNNDIYQTAIATLALKHVGENVTEQVEWLLQREAVNHAGGDWLLQFNLDASNLDTNCIVSHENEDFHFEVSGLNVIPATGVLEECQLENGLWANFESCINGESSGVYEYLSVECAPSSTSSLIYKIGDSEFYIIDESSPSLEIENGCFNGNSGDCSCEYTQYASWALDYAGNSSHAVPFLKSSCNDNGADNAFLYLLTSENFYQSWLSNNQNGLENWDNDIRSTALAAYSIKDSSSGLFNSAKGWLGFMQNINDGSWGNQNEQLTAFVLFAMTTGSSSDDGPDPEPDFAVCDNGNLETGEECELNFFCNPGEFCVDCLCLEEEEINETEEPECTYDSDCPPGFECDFGSCIVLQVECTYDSDCAYLGSSYACEGNVCVNQAECTYDSDCPSGFECDFGTCIVSQEQDTSECDEDYDCDEGEVCISGSCEDKPEESSEFWKWVIASLVVLIALAIGYYVYMKYFNKGGKVGKGSNPSTTRPSRPFYPASSQKVPVSSPAKSSRVEQTIEKDLDDALKKARKLVKR